MRDIVNAEKLQQLITAIQSPKYQHSRTRGPAGHGGNIVTYIYHRDETSPSGVMLATSWDACIVDPLIRALRDNSPLSPTEGLAR